MVQGEGALKMVQCTLVLAGIGVFMAVGGALLGWVVFPGAVHDKIIEVRMSDFSVRHTR